MSVKKHAKKNNVRMHVIGFFIILIFGVLVVANIKMYKKRQEYLTQIEGLKNQVKGIKSEDIKLQAGISNTNNDQYIEKVAREELDLQKPGEQAVSFILPSPTPAPQNANNNVQGILNNTLEWIKDKF